MHHRLGSLFCSLPLFRLTSKINYLHTAAISRNCAISLTATTTTARRKNGRKEKIWSFVKRVRENKTNRLWSWEEITKEMAQHTQESESERKRCIEHSTMETNKRLLIKSKNKRHEKEKKTQQQHQ